MLESDHEVVRAAFRSEAISVFVYAGRRWWIERSAMVQFALIALMTGIAAGTSFRVAFVVPLVAFGAAFAIARSGAAGSLSLAADIFLIAALVQIGYFGGACLLELASGLPATALRGPAGPSRTKRG